MLSRITNPVISRFLLVLVAASLAACQQVSPVANAPGTPTVQIDPQTRGPVAGVGIEGQDIIGMTDRMMRDMLASPELAGRSKAPQVIVDAQYFRNESSQRLNPNAITDRLRVGLNRASQGRMSFISRESADMVEQERKLKRDGKVDIMFEMIDLERGVIVWSGQHEFTRAGADDVIYGMADRMMRDMLASPELAGRSKAPQVIVDAQYFRNESSQHLNPNAITDRLRVGLNRASQGRMSFISRESADMVEQERKLKQDGIVDVATTGFTGAQAGADFRLRGRITSLDSRDPPTGMVATTGFTGAQVGADFRLAGRITSLDSRDPRTGMIQRFNQITFEMIDLERGVIVWSGQYEFTRAGADDVIYR